MGTVEGFDGIDFTDWILFKMLIKIYGEDKLIEVLKSIKENGGINEIHMRMF
jgi:hypothetical protein